MKKYRLLLIYFLITGLSLSYGIISYLNQRNDALKRVTGNINASDAKPVSAVAVNGTEKRPYLPGEKEPAPKAEPAAAENTQIDKASHQSGKGEGYALPAAGTAITPFSENSFVFSETTKDFRTHDGIDFKASEGESVFAVADGVVTEVNGTTSLGKTVKVDHGDGLVTHYACLSDVYVKAGDTVEKGGVLGVLGNAPGCEAALGTHLHFEAVRNGSLINPEELFLK